MSQNAKATAAQELSVSHSGDCDCKSISNRVRLLLHFQVRKEMWEFPKIRGYRIWGPKNKDPTVLFRALYYTLATRACQTRSLRSGRLLTTLLSYIRVPYCRKLPWGLFD